MSASVIGFLDLPDELLLWLAGFLDTPSAGLFAAASSTCKKLVHKKLVDTWNAYMLARNAMPVPRRITYTAIGAAFIDSHVDVFKTLAPAARKQLVEHILFEASKTHEAAFMLSSTYWTASRVMGRLKNTMKALNQAASASAALNQP